MMLTNSLPKFSKVEILLKNSGYGEKELRSITKIEFENCFINITGDYMIVILEEHNDVEKVSTSTCRVFHLSEVNAYKTYS